ncbi:S-layer homology domain-containing protein [Domibacillus enclensis]|uniref:S-layer homology domain-containing protein n=1 Tax=Domibacillus enclensis TaxID=1017273 RepID=A0A1N6RN73_9BACI|nr:S-layer homology domain-containing protein [Domibacillus enclensis]OXS79102.1 hypothetical protein B1B05_04805 [Domibacillus enclensis]SIQ30162.1 S-layer homology domain-containing protein [Domibacillus enclensis]
MVKKYPFSTKAAKAMIAATIAFTPVATTAGVFGADKVEAAQVQYDVHFSSKQNLINYAKSVYDPIRSDEDVVATISALKGITASEWFAIAGPVMDTNSDDQEVMGAAALLNLLLNKQTGVLTVENIDLFIAATQDNFNQAEEVDYLQYLENVEEEIYEYYSANQSAIISNPDFELVKGVLVAARNAEDPSGTIKPEIIRTLKIDDQSVQDAVEILKLRLLENGADSTEVKSAAAQFGAQWLTKYGYTPQPGNGNGGGVVTPPVDNGEVTPPATPGAEVEVTPAIVTENNGNVTATIPQALQAQIVSAVTVQTPRVAITLPQVTSGGAATLAIPGGLVQGILGVTQSATLTVTGPSGASINLPLGQLAGGFGSGFGSGTLNLTMKPATLSERTGLLSQVTNRLNGFGSGTGSASSETKAAALVGDVKMPAPATNVSISATISGQTVPVTTFGDIYIEREFPLTGAVDTNRTTGATIAADGTVKAIPTTFKTVEGTQFAVLKTLYNSADTYTVLETNQTFPDIDGGKNWAEKYIESLSSKFIISGTTAGTYKPDQDMTRSQFAFLLSRALGLPGTTAYDGRFSDIKGNEWFNANGEFMAAVQYGVIAGKTDGTFGADEKVTRAEAAAMIGRAMELGFIEFDKSQLDTSKTLAGFKDAKEIGASTRAEVLKVVQAGIMSGTSNGEFNPNDYTKRDQMARILAEFLMKADLMQDIK